MIKIGLANDFIQDPILILIICRKLSSLVITPVGTTH